MPTFFVSGTPFEAPGGPRRCPGGSKNLPKQCILLWLPPMPRNGLNKAQSWLNITEHIKGVMLNPFRPLESALGGARSTLKWPFLTQKWHIWDRKDHFWRSWGHPKTLLWGRTGPNRPPLMCLTMFNLFNQCSTHLGLLEVYMAKKCHFWARNYN